MSYSLEQALEKITDEEIIKYLRGVDPNWDQKSLKDKELLLLFSFRNFNYIIIGDLKYLNHPNFSLVFKDASDIDPIPEVKKKLDRNHDIVKLLEEIIEYYGIPRKNQAGQLIRDPQDVHRVKTFKNTASIIQSLDYIIYDQRQLEGIYGIGVKTLAIIREYLSRSFEIQHYLDTSPDRANEIFSYYLGLGWLDEGRIEKYRKNGKINAIPNRLIELKQQAGDAIITLRLFKSIFGIGSVAAIKFYNAGARSISDLTRFKLTTAQQIGVYYYNDLQERIPRPEMDLFRQFFSDTLDQHNVKWEIAGSYRRGEVTSGDIDLLVEQSPGVTIDSIVQLFSTFGFILGSLAQGRVKYMGVVKGLKARRMDIRLFSKETWPYALMYNTGSYQFNILCRQRAISLGIRLNEYSLTDTCGIHYPALSERDIFNHLGLKYLAPEERLESLTTLALEDSK